MARLAAIPGLLGLWLPAAARGELLAQRSRAEQERFMRRAFDLRDEASRAGDGGFGAVVVREGKIVGEGRSRVRSAVDPTAHAEVEAIRDAARKLATPDLSGCELYASFRPCRMCEAAAYWARIARFYYSESLIDGGAPNL
jgi:tRNA(Arg) A34 adenosine deaminase TadA